MLFLLLLIACQADDEAVVNHSIRIIGHGGSGFQTYYQNIPENSWPSFEKALFGVSVDGVEMDLQMSKDSILLLYHDQNLVTQTNCNGCIRQQAYAALQDCIYRFGGLTPKPKLLTFNTFLAKTRPFHLGRDFYLDLKFFEDCGLENENFSSYFQVMSPILTRQLKEYDLVENSILEFSNEAVLADFKVQNPDFIAYHYQNHFQQQIEATLESGADGIVIMNDRINKAEVQLAQENGLKVCVLTGGTLSSLKDAISKKPDAIQTDNPKLLKKLLNN